MRKSFIFTNEEVENFIKNVKYEDGVLETLEGNEIAKKKLHIPALDRKDWISKMNIAADNLAMISVKDLDDLYWKNGINMETDIRNVLNGSKIFLSCVHVSLIFHNKRYYAHDKSLTKIDIGRNVNNFSLPLVSVINKYVESIFEDYDKMFIYYSTDNIISQNEIILVLQKLDDEGSIRPSETVCFDNYTQAIEYILKK